VYVRRYAESSAFAKSSGSNGRRSSSCSPIPISFTGMLSSFAIANELGIPVKLIGIGEQLEDLRPFDPDDFAKALLTA